MAVSTVNDTPLKTVVVTGSEYFIIWHKFHDSFGADNRRVTTKGCEMAPTQRSVTVRELRSIFDGA